jgi:hypothetical protein
MVSFCYHGFCNDTTWQAATLTWVPDWLDFVTVEVFQKKPVTREPVEARRETSRLKPSFDDNRPDNRAFRNQKPEKSRSILERDRYFSMFR